MAGALHRRALLGVVAAAAFGGHAVANEMDSMGASKSGPLISVIPFAESRHAALDRLADIIIPANDTPGAREAGVTGFIELLYENWMTEEERQRFDVELETMMVTLQTDADPSLGLYHGGRFKAPMLRTLIIYGYYTSEVGASEELSLNLINGFYAACAPIASGDRAPSLYTWGISLDLGVKGPPTE